ncbi:L-lactate dehydrogenase complex protein LldE [Rhodopirellula rubra]|uniref:L-lactate dehydrogenase complex protein LldE n=1 Tax=Aporhodopirellula rubra TaxID=980271 RepID=A0A7W5E1K1_9BACT|nr:(Fe-S)-binding protein [Aporhodopirellula rubra]MBB3208426.1 L-lactate dehydrogenase complex protein LldE [Aporhodopirellula rubra]
MNVALFVPCYIDQFFPDVAISTLELLESQGLSVAFPEMQTCCGQPMANTGCTADAAPVARQFVEMFSGYDAVVCPSGSCTSMIRNHYSEYFADDDQRFIKLRDSTFELCEFLVDRLGVRTIKGRFPHRVSVHSSCHGLRELRLGACSEQMVPRENKLRILLESLEGVEVVPISRQDECCGFGGTFAVTERETSVAMGVDRVQDHVQSGSEVLVAGDMSCLMHMQGLIRRREMPMQVMHIAEVLAGRPLPTKQTASAAR